MFTDNLIELARRKERLIARTAAQRMVIADAYQRWQKPASVLDRGVAAVRFLKAHPLLLAIGVAAAAAMGRRNLLYWIGRGWVAWRAGRTLSAWVSRLGAAYRQAMNHPQA
jgi:hypothetical protein